MPRQGDRKGTWTMAHPRNTITLFFAGSGNSLSEGHGAIYAVPHLNELAVGRHFGLNGVGGNKNKTVRYEREGAGFKLQDGHKIELPDVPTDFQKDASAGHGRGVMSRIKKGMDYVVEQMNSAEPVKAVNLCGFSRGAVCCTYLAWLITRYCEKHPTLLMPQINMFLFDPVAGGLFGKMNDFKSKIKYDGTYYHTTRKSLPPTVQHFRGIVATRMINKFQKDKYFGSSMPKRGTTCDDYEVYVMPGEHEDATRYNDMPIGQIGYSIAKEFLMRHGSRFTDTSTMSKTEIAEKYAQILLGQILKKQVHQTQLLTQSNKILMTDNRSKAIDKLPIASDLEHPFFVNNHHEKIVEEISPSFANEIHKAVGSYGMNRHARRVSGASWRWLENHGYDSTKLALITLRILPKENDGVRGFQHAA
ncbi:MAG: hypothetical protein AAFU80_22845 [Pseudomonadota bacterium]